DRVRSVPTRPLPEGWVGKQFACAQLGRHAAGAWLLFTDADVRFEPECLACAMAAAQQGEAVMLSTFPRQRTGTPGEALLVPMIHFILFSYLPMGRMRRSLDPAASAGCGQFVLVRRDAYEAIGGHGSVRASMHEGIMLPRLLRRAGFATDLFDGTSLVSCRMYHGLAAAWRGFAKNAFEGVGSIWILLLFTVLHGLGHVLPWAYLVGAWGLNAFGREATGPALAAIVIALLQRQVLAWRFRQSIVAALLHPVGIAAMTLVQWYSYVLWRLGRREWRGRRQGAAVQPANAS
ncbi:MAG: glycosyltransferase family 2 protein, partial [Planctomycetota bacterium]